MLSKTRIKFLSSLSIKKFRESTGMFIAEGEKIVTEILSSGNKILEPVELLATEEYLSSLTINLTDQNIIITNVLVEELKKISALSTPNKAVLVIKIPGYVPDPEIIRRFVSLVLEDIRDPGNLGTIIRTADWFGIRNIFCSNESVDVFNPKTIQSTMGAVARVMVHYTDLKSLLMLYKERYKMEIAGTLLDGEDVDKMELPKPAMIVFGNESHGISNDIKSILTHKIKIPSAKPVGERSESLNVASSVAIMCWEFCKPAPYSK